MSVLVECMSSGLSRANALTVLIQSDAVSVQNRRTFGTNLARRHVQQREGIVKRREQEVKIRQLPDGRWQLDYIDPRTGKRARPAFINKAIADGEKRLVEDMMRGGLDPAATRLRFGQVADEYLSGYTGARAIPSNLRNHVLPHWEDVLLRNIAPIDVQRWVNLYRETDYSPYTVDAIYNAFACVMSYARQKQYIADTPCHKIERPYRTKRTVPPEAAEDFKSVAAAMPRRYRLIPLLAIALGARVSEVLGLTVDRVNTEELSVLLDRQLNEGGFMLPPKFGMLKGKRPRTVDVSPMVIGAIVEHLAEHYTPNDAGLLFTDEDGWPLGYDRLNRMYREAWTDAGVTMLDRFHDLRHLSASVAYQGGASMVEISARLGHDQLRTTELYVHQTRARSERSVNAIDRALF